MLSVIPDPFVDVLQVGIGRRQGGQQVAPDDEAPQPAGLPGVIEDRQQADPVELVAERAAGKPCRPQAEHHPAAAALADLLHPDRGARRHQRRPQRGQVRRLPAGQRGADVGGHPAPVRAAQAPGRAEDLEARPGRRPAGSKRGKNRVVSGWTSSGGKRRSGMAAIRSSRMPLDNRRAVVAVACSSV